MTDKKITTTLLKEMKMKNEKIVVLTAYDFLTAEILDEIGIEVILVGDSVGMVFSGYKNTIPVSMDEMIYHTRAVSRAVKKALVIGDMPFMSFHISIEETIKNVGRFLQEGGAEAVKIEGGIERVPTVEAIIKNGVPVMGHLGLTPQSIYQFGGYHVQAQTEHSAALLFESAKALEQAGCFSIVLEKIPWQVAKKVTESISIPTIGIGAGPYCDGQVLVLHDILGLYKKFAPKFVKRYAELSQIIKTACSKYRDEVKSGSFPTFEHSYSLNDRNKQC